jgi:hypothetical protein
MESSFEIDLLILVEPDFGKERWPILRNIAELFLGTKPRDLEIMKWYSLEWTTTQPREIFLKIWGHLPFETYKGPHS